ncbi:MAG: hypothetical protein KTR31_34990 [Myxococcales bacterium]|nr:hypothetical protein [Myxococcales bacterium]
MWVLALWAGLDAHAVDLDTWLELGPSTFSGPGGNDGNDEATDVVIDATGHVIAVGIVDGKKGRGTDGYLVTLEYYDLRFLWDLTFDADETDRLNAIANPGTNDLAFCGRNQDGFYAVATTPHPYGIHYVPYDSWGWTLDAAIGACYDMERAGTTLYAAGRSEDLGGIAFRVAAGTGKGDPAFTFSDGLSTQLEAFQAVAADRKTGAFAVAGTSGRSDVGRDWFVRGYDAAGEVAWTHILPPAPGHDAGAYAITYDQATNSVTAAGHETANGGGNWLVVSYDLAGDGTGQPSIRWTHRFGSGTGHDDVATSIDVDADGHVVVGGGHVPKKTGIEVWRLAKLDGATGQQLQEWLGPDHAGDSRIQGLHIRDRKIAFAGYVDDGVSRDFVVNALDPDDDSDGTPNSPDECPEDPGKIESGICGCGVSDLDDGDADATPDCIDRCPEDPTKSVDDGLCGCNVPDVDSDGDRVLDCFDECPDDAEKVEALQCGCGVPESDDDLDADGILDCIDECILPEDCPETSDSSCGCHTPVSGGWWLGALAAILAFRRRDPAS